MKCFILREGKFIHLIKEVYWINFALFADTLVEEFFIAAASLDWGVSLIQAEALWNKPVTALSSVLCWNSSLNGWLQWKEIKLLLCHRFPMISFLACCLSKGFGTLGTGVKRVCISLLTKQILWNAEEKVQQNFLVTQILQPWWLKDWQCTQRVLWL